MFFGYFLNIKKVTPSADFVISPRESGGLPLFPHAASTFTPVGATTGQRGSAAGEMEPNGGKHRFLRSENRDEIEEVKQNAMSLV